MKSKILHESRGRIRVHVERRQHMTLEEAELLETRLLTAKDIQTVTVFERTGDVVITYHPGQRDGVIRALAGFSFEKCRAEGLEVSTEARALNRKYKEQLVSKIVVRYLKKMYLPMPIRTALTAANSLKFVWKGLKCLAARKLEVPVLDAVAISVSELRGDFETAGSVMFLLTIGEILEEWTHKKSVADLAKTMSLNVDKVWVRVDGTELLMPVCEVPVGSEIIVRTGSLIPLDGKVIEGEATVNQASMTGESVPVPKSAGSYVYAGTVVEEGNCVIQVEQTAGSGRYDRIVDMIEASEKLKSSMEDQASHLANRLVPYSLGATALTWLITRNPTKALSILMVDFCCALKLSMPLAVLSAMREAGRHQTTVKGGRFLELIADADTIVFDKTGTLTHASPRVRLIVPFGEHTEDEVLRTAACLEEHYPHSIANAVVEAAKMRGLHHAECHSEVEYVVAHGIASRIDGEKVIIGSYHFVFEDECCSVPKGEEWKLDTLPEYYSHLFLAQNGILQAVLCIEDPLREEAPAVVSALHELGISKVVMMTGDNFRTARRIADEVHVDEFHADVLPEDKAAFVRAEHAAGRKVIMIGDGINDSPALSEADVGIAISDGAAIARQIADITIGADDLQSLVTLKEISNALTRRIHQNYRNIMVFNTGLIVLGVAGVLPPATTALLHNTSTIAFSLHSMTSLLPPDQAVQS